MSASLPRAARPLVPLACAALVVALADPMAFAAGPLSGRDATATLSPTGQARAAFGTAVASVGDLDGDGHDDVAVGVPLWNGADDNEGRVYVYRGSADGLNTSPTTLDPTDQFGSQFGASVAAAGDVNADGFDDMLVGSPWWDGTTTAQTDEGRVYLYLGGSGGLQATPVTVDPTNQSFAGFGAAASGAGDLNGDGYDDVVVGTPDWNGTNADEGRADVYFGSASGLTGPTTLEPADQRYAAFGASVAGAGDVDADGFADLLVGAPEWGTDPTEGEGSVWLYRGSATGLRPVPAVLNPTDQLNAAFGSTVAGAGDLNGDGFDDVALAAPGMGAPGTGTGRVFLMKGSAGGLVDGVTLTPPDPDATDFGAALSGPADLDGDGRSDIVVGSPGREAGDEHPGAAWLYTGASQGLVAPGVQVTGPSDAEATFAVALDLAGDVNGDGTADLLVGAPDQDGTARDEGAVLVWSNRAPTLSAPADVVGETGVTQSFSMSAADVDGDDLVFTADGLPYGANVDPLTGAFSWTPTGTQAGTYDVVMRVSDGVSSAVRPLTMTITEPGDPDTRTDTVTSLIVVDRGADLRAGGRVTPETDFPTVRVKLWHRRAGVFEVVSVVNVELGPHGGYVTQFADAPASGLCRVTAWYHGGETTKASRGVVRRTC